MDATPIKRYLKRVVSSYRMRRLDGAVIPDDHSEIRMFMAVRNESLRLPAMISYHQELGVDRIFVIDNDSSDGTLDYLKTLPNVHVFSTKESFERKEAWIDVLLRQYGEDHWCLLMDADEQFVYPFADRISLRQFTGYLDRAGVTALHTVLLDMYSNAHTQDVDYQAGDSLTECSSYFDPPAYTKERFIYRNCIGNLDYRFVGGLRKRLFYEGTVCSNFPLVKFSRKMFVPAGRHSVEGATIADARGVLQHFKFLQDFIPKAQLEAERGVHWGKAITYKNYAAFIAREGDVNPYNEASVRYQGPAQLLKLGLMTVPESLVSYVHEIAARE